MTTPRIEFRTDQGELRRFEVTGSGGVRIEAALTRVGVFDYFDGQGTRSRELKPPEEVFRQTALESLRDATVEHSNFKRLFAFPLYAT